MLASARGRGATEGALSEGVVGLDAGPQPQGALGGGVAAILGGAAGGLIASPPSDGASAAPHPEAAGFALATSASPEAREAAEAGGAGAVHAAALLVRRGEVHVSRCEVPFRLKAVSYTHLTLPTSDLV